MVILVIIVAIVVHRPISGRVRRRVIEGPGAPTPSASQELIDPTLVLVEGAPRRDGVGV